MISVWVGLAAVMLIFMVACIMCYRAEKADTRNVDSILMSGEEYNVKFKSDDQLAQDAGLYGETSK
jgi:hypothetical protein